MKHAYADIAGRHEIVKTILQPCLVFFCLGAIESQYLESLEGDPFPLLSLFYLLIALEEGGRVGLFWR